METTMAGVRDPDGSRALSEEGSLDAEETRAALGKEDELIYFL